MPPGLNDYSYFVQCVREYLKQGYGQKEAVVRATDECIEKGILKDILVKHRAEVVDMFLTTFDKKMYEEAVLEEGIEKGRAEMAEEVEKERKRADEERKRAIEAESENARLREEIARLKGEK